MSTPLFAIFLLAAAIFAVFLWVRLPKLIGARSGRILLLLALFVAPLLLIPVGVGKSLHDSKKKDFCTSCHEMRVYDVSLQIDDSEYVPANHYQNRLVPQETACYTCHTDYTLFGDVKAKMSGMKHLWVHYFGDVPEPGETKLYSPYPNDNCLQCHRGGKRFEKKGSHNSDGVTVEMLYANQKSCVSKGCHDKIHDISHLASQDLWGEPRWPLPESLIKRAKEEAPAAEDPFAEPAGGGAKDPFADEKPAPDAGGGAVDPFANEPDVKPAEPDAKPAEGDAAKPAEPDAKPAEGDVKPAEPSTTPQAPKNGDAK